MPPVMPFLVPPADKEKVTQFVCPEIPNNAALIKKWWYDMISAVMAACQDPDRVLGWLHAIPDASFVDLGDTGENKKLDAMLFQAVKDAKKGQ